MHLKSLTLRGFKSFAGSTTLQLEPGLTCVVGPNGSGKSNVVDAIAWVLGEQGAKALRGGKMEDVIFAGSPGRPPLGRAEVQLTIDNSDGALPIEYAEVTIGRLMYRSGESEYTINGSPCRLLDVQELLSDSGIGREMHVIVGQGSLDAVLGRAAGGSPRLHRGGRRRPQAPQAQGTRAAQARDDRHQRRAARPTWPLSCAASSVRWVGRPRPPGGPASSRRRCATPGCGCWPTTWSTAGKALEARGEADGALAERLADGEARLARRAGSRRGADAPPAAEQPRAPKPPARCGMRSVASPSG